MKWMNEMIATAPVIADVELYVSEAGKDQTFRPIENHERSNTVWCSGWRIRTPRQRPWIRIPTKAFFTFISTVVVAFQCCGNNDVSNFEHIPCGSLYLVYCAMPVTIIENSLYYFSVFQFAFSIYLRKTCVCCSDGTEPISVVYQRKSKFASERPKYLWTLYFCATEKYFVSTKGFSNN